MILNEFGKIVSEQWVWLSENFPYVVLHEFVIMPDHFHGVIEINRDLVVVGSSRDDTLRQGDEIKIKSLSELMGAFKTTASKKIHRAGFDTFKWQNSFHDRVIRNLSEYIAVSEYIKKNPERATS
jgi:REP element-mobilizing transposase RayT